MMKCKVCGKEIEYSRYQGDPICSSKCFHEDYWNQTLDDSAIIIDGVCYHDGGAKSEGYQGFLGFGGRVFTIRMKKDSRVFKTNNLWLNGDVPSERNVEDNAEFIYKTTGSDPVI